eukprot:5496300-Prymnesium_polylepis.1
MRPGRQGRPNVANTSKLRGPPKYRQRQTDGADGAEGCEQKFHGQASCEYTIRETDVTWDNGYTHAWTQ